MDSLGLYPMLRRSWLLWYVISHRLDLEKEERKKSSKRSQFWFSSFWLCMLEFNVRVEVGVKGEKVWGRRDQTPLSGILSNVHEHPLESRRFVRGLRIRKRKSLGSSYPSRSPTILLLFSLPSQLNSREEGKREQGGFCLPRIRDKFTLTWS